MNDLLLTSDLDVLESTLFTLLRLAQQYGTHTPFEPRLGYMLIGRVLALCRSWDKLSTGSQTLASLASGSPLVLSEQSSRPRLQFYPTTGQSASGPQDIDLIGNSILSTTSSINDRVSLLSEEKSIALEDQVTAVNRLRLACLLTEKPTREKLLVIHLLALSTYREYPAVIELVIDLVKFISPLRMQ